MILTLIAVIPSSVNALSVIDRNIDYSSVNIDESNDIELSREMVQSEKIIIKNTGEIKEVHLFDYDEKRGESSYRKSFIQEESKYYSFIDENMQQEDNSYASSGFDGIPDIHLTNVKNHEIFVDQAKTGRSASNNCGPSVIEMAMRWANPESEITAEKARREIRPEGGWLNTMELEIYLSMNGLKTFKIDSPEEEDLLDILNNGEVAILCLNAGKISRETDRDSRIGRFYDYSSGHFLLLTGYIVSGEELYFEVFDSNTWGKSLSDGNIPAGKGRYIKSEELITSIKTWWDYAIRVKG